MDRGWAEFWGTLWHTVGTFFFTIVWPIAITVYMFAFTNITRIGGNWGLVAGGLVIAMIGNTLTGSAAGYSGQADSSGFVNLTYSAGSPGVDSVIGRLLGFFMIILGMCLFIHGLIRLIFGV